ncbi:MAG: hypothetical protein ACTHU0_39260 [Kofleriaceae bacterium]
MRDRGQKLLERGTAYADRALDANERGFSMVAGYELRGVLEALPSSGKQLLRMLLAEAFVMGYEAGCEDGGPRSRTVRK